MNPFKSAKIIGENIDPAVYIRQEAKRGDKDYIMSRSDLVEFARCPHRWINGYSGDDESKSTEWGSLIDCLALQPERFADFFSVAPETYPDSKTGEPKTWNWNANYCKEWREKQGTKAIVKSNIKAAADTAIETLFDDEHLRELISCSRKQVFVMAQYFDKQTGLTIPVKALLDLVPNPENERFGKCLSDFKTSFTANPDIWESVCCKRHYHTQAAVHMDAYVKATGEDRTDWLHAIQENFPPYETCGCHVSGDLVEAGRFVYVQALRLYAYCLTSGHWPRYSDRPAIIEGFPTINMRDWMTKPEAAWSPFADTEPVKQEQDLSLAGAN